MQFSGRSNNFVPIYSIKFILSSVCVALICCVVCLIIYLSFFYPMAYHDKYVYNSLKQSLYASIGTFVVTSYIIKKTKIIISTCKHYIMKFIFNQMGYKGRLLWVLMDSADKITSKIKQMPSKAIDVCASINLC